MENERQICELLSNMNDRLMQMHLTLTTIGVGVFDNGTMDQNVRNQFIVVFVSPVIFCCVSWFFPFG